MPTTSLREPPDDLTGFPWTYPPRALWRVCRRANSTWWFSSDGSGRFDLAPPEGTCYFATDAYAAIREATRLGPVTPHWVGTRDLATVAPPDPRAHLAATTRRAAGAYGVTSELATLVPYDVPRRWAIAFSKHGFDGIRHELRHDQRARPSGVAWFGVAGTAAHADGRRQPLTVELTRRCGVAVIDVPTANALTILHD